MILQLHCIRHFQPPKWKQYPPGLEEIRRGDTEEDERGDQSREGEESGGDEVGGDKMRKDRGQREMRLEKERGDE